MPENPTMVSLHTERLLLRPFRAEDFDAYAALCADAEVMRYLGGAPLSREDAWRQLAMFVGHWQLRGFGIWAVEERQSGELVGRIGLHFPEGWPGRELSWTLARRFWGRGLAYEGGRAALTHAFSTLGWERIISLIHPQNERSIRLAERLGMRCVRLAEARGHQVKLFETTSG
jgi:RimJ/RimL family protein N-acetyltransferase